MGKDLESSKKQLFTFAMKGKWEDVIELYKKEPRLHKARITKSRSTALHVAVRDGNEEVVEQMVKLAETCPILCKEVLETQNDRKNTALHVAASMGNLRICHLIAQKHPSLVNVRNVDGETPIFLAALHGRKEAFLCLHYLSHPNGSSPNYVNCRRNDGNTFLHCAIAGNFYDLAFQIIHLYEDLVNGVNEEGLSALHLLAAKPSDFKSGNRLGRYEMIIYHCIFVEELKPAEYSFQQSFSDEGRNPNCNIPDNHRTWCDFFGVVKTSLAVVTNKFPAFHFSKDNIFSKGQPPNAGDPEMARNNNSQDCRARHQTHQLYPENYETCCSFFRFVYLVVTLILGQGSSRLKRIRREKEKHVWSLQILNELCHSLLYEFEDSHHEIDETALSEDSHHEKDEISFSVGEIKIIRPGNDNQQQHGGADEKKNGEPKERRRRRIETPLLVAAKYGVLEIVKKIMADIPSAIHDINHRGQNVLHVAVEYRQPHIFRLLRHQRFWDNLLGGVDFDGNTVLHLAAKSVESLSLPGLSYGSGALQLQRLIKWYEHVKSLVPPRAVSLLNKKGETPGQIFIGQHKELVKTSGEWLNRTSESCSVVAALVVGVSFATSSTLPGGNDDKTGKPTLDGRPVFELFALAALIALCFSVVALIMFLSILTSQKQPTDFKKKLPVKLFIALSSLFVSIVSMFASFCAAHSFVLEDKFNRAIIPLYAATCLPVYFTIVEFPLYMDLFETIVSEVQRPYDYGYL
ncbi:uncharacterized protein LOC129296114 [Prosopis cineraria]|uniref:uncharacterized protein LOC129296114 n=1 Tax=Prosopis cineraria TaxID=364024 RepID=UPI002410A376|nr:uncharacterized protein LOC129296114 [Prosopis cineraria]